MKINGKQYISLNTIYLVSGQADIDFCYQSGFKTHTGLLTEQFDWITIVMTSTSYQFVQTGSLV